MDALERLRRLERRNRLLERKALAAFEAAYRPPAKSLADDLSRKKARARVMPGGKLDEASARFLRRASRAALREFGASEAAAPGWEDVAKHMKKHPEIENPFALTRWMAKRGFTPRKDEADGSYRIYGDARGGMKSHTIYESCRALLEAARAKVTDVKAARAGRAFDERYRGGEAGRFDERRVAAAMRPTGGWQQPGFSGERVLGEGGEESEGEARKTLRATAEKVVRVLDRHLERWRRLGERAWVAEGARGPLPGGEAEWREALDKLKGHFPAEAATKMLFGMSTGGSGYEAITAEAARKLAELYSAAMTEAQAPDDEDGEGDLDGEDEDFDEADGEDEPDDDEPDLDEEAERQDHEANAEVVLNSLERAGLEPSPLHREEVARARERRRREAGEPDAEQVGEPEPWRSEFNYRYSGDPDRSCGVCAFFEAAASRCRKFDAAVRSVDLCDAFEPKLTREAMRACEMFDRSYER